MSNPLGSLGAPIGSGGTAQRAGFDQGEHGAGTGLTGRYGEPNAQDTQAGYQAQQAQTGFNSGLSAEHASAGTPAHKSTGSTGSSHPIADKFTGSGSDGSKLDNSLDQYSVEGHHGYSYHTHGSGLVAGAAGLAGAVDLSSRGIPRGEGGSGSYEGAGTGDALTGQSHALRTGAGVGPQGGNLTSSSGHHGSDLSSSTQQGRSHGKEGLLAGASAAVTGGAVAGAAPRTSLGSEETHTGSGNYGTGESASGGAGGHYDTSDSTRTGTSGLGAGAAGAAAGGKTGKYGHAEEDFDRGAPVADPKELDSGGRHGLVFQESTGKYVHRHELEKN